MYIYFLPTLSHSVSFVSLVTGYGAGYRWRGLSSPIILTPVTSSCITAWSAVIEWHSLQFFFSFSSFMSPSALFDYMRTAKWSNVVLQGPYVGVSFEDSLLSTLLGFLCHSMGRYLCFPQHCLLIRYAWMSGPICGNLCFLSASTESFSCYCACLVITCPFPLQSSSHVVTGSRFYENAFFLNLSIFIKVM